MKTRYIIAILALLMFVNLFAQTDTLNRADEFNCKYGYWKVYTDVIDEPKLIEDGLYVNGRKFGLWNAYYKDGTKKNELTFVDGRPKGYMVLYNIEGDTSECGYYINNRWTGNYRSFFSGNRRQHVFFFNEKGKRSGCQLYYNEAGEIVREADYIDGKELFGRDFYDDGTVKEEAKDNRTTYYDKAGKIISNCTFHKGSKKSYTETTYHQNGNTATVVSYVDGKRNGNCMTYYDNGNLKTKGAYKAGKLSGKRLYYNTAGKKMNGAFVMYTDGIKAERTGTCINGKPEGELKVYDLQGHISMLVNFKRGQPDGNTYYYTHNKLTLTEIYSKGVFVTGFTNKVTSAKD
jgi:antitoxin component YwqK of YwqJK toxin-antitoxin module